VESILRLFLSALSSLSFLAAGAYKRQQRVRLI